MNATAEVDKSGRLVLPKKMRDALHLVPGTRVTLVQNDTSIVIEPESTGRLVWKNGRPVYDFGRPLPPGHENWLDEAREERTRQLTGVEIES